MCADLQAALVPLVLILGGSTVSSILLGLVPGWVVTPVPVATYGCVQVSFTLQRACRS